MARGYMAAVGLDPDAIYLKTMGVMNIHGLWAQVYSSSVISGPPSQRASTLFKTLSA